MIRVIAVLSVGLPVLLSTSQVLGEARADRSWMCSNESHKREVALFSRTASAPASEFACWVVYTRNGRSEMLWQARHNADYCEPKALELIEKLASAGFECRASDMAGPAAQREESLQEATDDSADVLPGNATAGMTSRPTDVSAPMRSLLEEHYVGSYLEAMIAAMPDGFVVDSSREAVSPGNGEYLYVAPPKNFVKTLSDGAYLLVNTTVLEREASTSHVHFGFLVRGERFRFLGYATISSASQSRVVDADTDRIVVSVTKSAGADCAPLHRTETIAWHADIHGPRIGAMAETMDDPVFDDCEN